MTPNDDRNIVRLPARLRWVTTTPFGAPVDPEVYCSRAGASAGTARGPARGAQPAVASGDPKRRNAERLHGVEQVAAVGVAERGRRRGVAADGGDPLPAAIARAAAARHRDRARIEAAEERGREPERRTRQHQHRTPRDPETLQGAGDVERGAAQVGEAQRSGFPLAVSEKDQGATIGPLAGPALELRREERPASRGDGTDTAPLTRPPGCGPGHGPGHDGPARSGRGNA